MNAKPTIFIWTETGLIWDGFEQLSCRKGKTYSAPMTCPYNAFAKLKEQRVVFQRLNYLLEMQCMKGLYFETGFDFSKYDRHI